MGAARPIVVIAVVIAAACGMNTGSADPPVESFGAAIDGGCPGTPVPCCQGGCDGHSVIPAFCDGWRLWECPVGTVSPDDCAPDGVRWCSGGPLPPDAGGR